MYKVECTYPKMSPAMGREPSACKGFLSRLEKLSGLYGRLSETPFKYYQTFQKVKEVACKFFGSFLIITTWLKYHHVKRELRKQHSHGMTT